MSTKGLWFQNIIAVIWDFDKTLSPHYMQKPLFEHYGIDETQFWDQVRHLPDYYKRAGIHVQRDTCYLGHLLSYVHHGKMPGLTNAKLRELGGEIEFYPGLPEFFGDLASVLEDPALTESDLRLEHYVVSTGLTEMVRGSQIAPHLAGLWASEFIETPADPDTDLKGTPVQGPISQIACFLDNTTKTRALFEINKGVRMQQGVTVNDTIPEEDRRVPFKNMIYIADGPSDIPSFSVVRKHGGRTFAVYDSPKQFEQVVSLHENGRIDSYGPADYQEDSQTAQWLRLQVKRIAERIMLERKQAQQSRVRKGPEHLAEEDSEAK